MKKSHSVVHELIISIILGSIPLICSYLQGGEKTIKVMIKSLQASDFVVVYFGVLLVLYIVFKCIERLLRINKNSTKKALGFILTILSEVGTGLIGVFRVFAGVLISLPIFWFLIERHTFDNKISVLIISVGVGLLFLNKCLAISTK